MPRRAYELFRQAAAHMNELDPITAQRLQDHLQLLSAPSRTQAARSRRPGQAPSLADETAARQQVLARQVAAELAHKESNARAMRDTDPKGALAMLEEARKKVEASGLDSSTRDQLLRRVDRAIAETKQFIEQNRPQIELAEKNNRIQQDVERRTAGEGRGRREARHEDRRVQQAHGRAALRRGAGRGQAGRRAGPARTRWWCRSCGRRSSSAAS